MSKRPEPVSHIILGGKEVEMEGRYLPYTLTGLAFTMANTRCLPRELDIDLLTHHDSAGLGNPERVYRTLLRKYLSVEFCGGADGVVYQFADPMVFSCAHMGPGNRRSIGAEWVNLVLPERGLWGKVVYRLQEYPAKYLFNRPSVTRTFRGRKRQVIGHTKEQQLAALYLTKGLLKYIETIPPKLPLDEQGGKVHGNRVDKGFRGIAGHCHFTNSHVDPAGDIFDGLLSSLAE